VSDLLLLRLRAQAGATERWSERLVEAATDATARFEADGDDVRLATTWRLLAWAYGTSCHYGLATRAAEKAIEHARRASDARQTRRAAAQYAQAALHGPTPVSEAIRHCEEITAEAHGDRRTEGLVSTTLASLLAMRGDFDEARRLYTDAQAMLKELGSTVVGASTSLATSWVEWRAGDLDAAERELRRDYATLTELGEKYLLSTIAGELARVLYAQGRFGEAEEMSLHAQGLADGDDIASQTLWRTVYAKVLARAGNADMALIVIGEAVDMLARTDAVVAQADTLVALADVLKLSGRNADADGILEDAVALLDAKEDLVSAGAIRTPATSA
jgi:ATP/maltotriose-dependent transcriptional regulator MalT